jgi:hypothetical protein
MCHEPQRVWLVLGFQKELARASLNSKSAFENKPERGGERERREREKKRKEKKGRQRRKGEEDQQTTLNGQSAARAYELRLFA